jgi:hypothetical protein
MLIIFDLLARLNGRIEDQQSTDLDLKAGVVCEQPR